MASQLTVREVATLANVTVRAVNKAVEDRIVVSIKHKGSKRVTLPLHTVPYAAVIDRLGVPLSAEKKRKLLKVFKARRPKDMTTTPVEISPFVSVDVANLVGADLGQKTAAYAEAKERLIECNPEILGGTPVIKGTRISVYSLLGRLEDGDEIRAIRADHPDLSDESIHTAIMFARTHPMVGRPGGRPWEARR